MRVGLRSAHVLLMIVAATTTGTILATSGRVDQRVSRSGLVPEAVAAPTENMLARWGEVSRKWIQSSALPAAFVARGVVLECFSASVTGAITNSDLEREYVEACGTERTVAQENLRPGRVQSTYWSIELLGRSCSRRAREAYDDALKRDDHLTEAHLRRGSLTVRQPRTSPLKQDDSDLLQVLAVAPSAPMNYLASMFLGLGAENRGDLRRAAERYAAAHGAGSDWPSAAYALSAVLLREGDVERARELILRDFPRAGEDPWYSYACTILTPEIREAWAARVEPR